MGYSEGVAGEAAERCQSGRARGKAGGGCHRQDHRNADRPLSLSQANARRGCPCDRCRRLRSLGEEAAKILARKRGANTRMVFATRGCKKGEGAQAPGAYSGLGGVSGDACVLLTWGCSPQMLPPIVGAPTSGRYGRETEITRRRLRSHSRRGNRYEGLDPFGNCRVSALFRIIG